MLELDGFSKHYGDIQAVEDLSISIDQGDLVTLLGPSGCGKSTTLHAIGGLIEPTAGNIYLRGTDVTDAPPEKRNIGIVFQETALFPHMDVEANINYGLKMHGITGSEAEERITDILELVGMPEYKHHLPEELSGGQQQRIALARALVYEPDLVLLDEPLTGLDRMLRENMRTWIKSIQEEIGVTMLYVTHDQGDALSMSDQIIIMKDGEKQQEGGPQEVYEKPANHFVAEFIGKSTKFEVTISDETYAKTNDDQSALLEAVDFSTANRNHPANDTDTAISVFVRPEDLHVDTVPQNSGIELPGTVSAIDHLGNLSEVSIQLDNDVAAISYTERFPALSKDDSVVVRFNPEDAIVL